MSSLKKIIIVFIITIIFGIIIVNTKSRAVTINLNTYSDMDPFKNVDDNGPTWLYCREKGGSVRRSFGNLSYTNIKEGNLSEKLAYALYLANGKQDVTHNTNNKTIQQIIWQQYSGSSRNLGTILAKNITNPSCSQQAKNIIGKAKSYKSSGTIKPLNTDSTEAKRIEHTETITNADGTTSEEKILDYYLIGPIQLKFTKSDTSYIKSMKLYGYNDNDSESEIEYSFCKKDGTKRELDVKDIKSGNKYYLKCKKDLKEFKSLKVKGELTYNSYSGEYTFYKATKRVKGTRWVQNMISVTAKETKNTKDYEITIGEISNNVRVVTVKYISEINGEDVTKIAPRAWVDVDVTKDVDDDKRYTIHHQDTSQLVINPGDIVEYTIIVYNVGDTEWNPQSDQDFQADDDYVRRYKQPYTNPKGYTHEKGISFVYDIPENYENMELMSRNVYEDGHMEYKPMTEAMYKYYDSDSNKYNYTDAINNYTYDWWYVENSEYGEKGVYKRPINYKLTAYNSDDPDNSDKHLGEGSNSDKEYYHPNDNREDFNQPVDEGQTYKWHTHIYFKIKEEGEITNNDVLSTSEEKNIKYLYSITDQNGNETKLKEPTIEANKENLSKTQPRYDHPDPTIMNGYKLKYGIRYYSVGKNKRELNYPIDDTFGPGLVLESIEGTNKWQETTKIEENVKYTTMILSAPENITLEGYNKERRDYYDPDTRIGSQNGFKYYEIFLTFTVNVNPIEVSYVTNNAKNSIILRTGYEIKGKVFIDKEKLSEEGKILNPRNALLDEETDNIAEKVKVELLYTNGNNVADIWDNGTPYIQDKATKELYPTTVYTNDKGEYTFTHLPAREITIDSEGNIVGNEDISTPYRIRFTYNGQEYENVEYNKDTYAGKGSYATEGNKNRADFNSKFTTINSTNSEKYTLKPKENKSVAEGKGPDGEYNISSYTGSSGWNSNNGIINVDTTYKENVNLGLVKRDFDLDLTNRLVSMDISINDVKQTLNNINNNGISKELENQDVYFKESDYNYTNESNSNKELNVWVNYEITIKNSSIDKFNGILNNINLYYDERFDDIEIPPELGRTEISGVAGFKGVNINFGSEGKIISTNADNAYKIKIRLHLNRQTIADALKNNNESMITFNTIAEIASYGSTYNGDIYKNGHGVNNPNAGKIDEDSNAGSFKIDEYAYSDKDGKIEILKEDDTSRAIGIQLKKDGSSRTLSGIVFEDVREQRNVGNSNSKTRLGNGEYNQEDNDKKIQNVTVELYEIDDQIPMEVYNGTEWKESTVKSNQNGEYKISGFIPSNNYVVKFTYGDGSTDIYNAQDYKSTIDKTSNDYDATKAIDENGYSTGEGNYWYRDENIKRKSIAKDEDTRMTTNNYGIEGTLTNSSAINLEDYQNVINDEKIFKNTATTARFCVPIRSDGNKNSNADKYEISNINLGLAERPRSELTIEKTVDHVSITATDGSPIVDGTQGAKGISWTNRYVQPIVDENLIYGSKLTVTYKIKVTNTGEVDYNPGEDKLDENNKSSKTGTRKFYDYGIKREDKDIITTKADQVIDYTDNNLTYDKNEKAAPNVKDNDNVNSNYWLEATDIDSYLDEDTKTYYNTVTTKLITEELNQNLKPGDSSKEVYLTQTKILSQNDVNDQMAYDNYVEIIESTNDAGRRNYHTTEISSDGITLSANYNNVLLSDVENRGTPVKEHMTSENDKYLVLSIPGDLGDPKDTTTTTLNFEPDSSAAQNIQIVQPFGDEKNYNITILAIIITTSGLILAGGIYLIKKKVL